MLENGHVTKRDALVLTTLRYLVLFIIDQMNDRVDAKIPPKLTSLQLKVGEDIVETNEWYLLRHLNKASGFEIAMEVAALNEGNIFKST